MSCKSLACSILEYVTRKALIVTFYDSMHRKSCVLLKAGVWWDIATAASTKGEQSIEACLISRRDTGIYRAWQTKFAVKNRREGGIKQ